MAIDISKVKARLAALNQNNTKTTSLWKPEPGKNVIRILPYKFSKDGLPFIELFFHYNINKKNYLSPSTLGKPDPFLEFANKLQKTGDKEDWKHGKKMEPKLRTYVPMIERGKESEGVKFWGFGKQVYQDLLSIIADPDYGDIFDIKEGRDITVEFKTAAEVGKDFPETTVLSKPNVSVASTDDAVLIKIKDQKNILDLFPETSYEDLQAILEKWLNPDSVEELPDNAEVTTSETAATPDEGSKDPVSTGSPSADKSKTNVTTNPSATKVADEFDKLFASS
jgi:hypothetical protein